MSDLIRFDGNPFIEAFDNLYTRIYYYKDVNMPLNEPKKKKKEGFAEFWKRVLFEDSKEKTKEESKMFVYKQTEVEYNRLKEEYFREHSPEFNTLWTFCQFIRYAEKTIFYVNDNVNGKCYVDSDLLDMTKRRLSIKRENYDINLFLEKIENPTDKFSPFKVITLEVNRKYGKQMSNKFKIVNQDIKYNDYADVLLIEVVNKILIESMEESIKEIFKLLEAGI